MCTVIFWYFEIFRVPKNELKFILKRETFAFPSVHGSAIVICSKSFKFRDLAFFGTNVK